MPGDVGRQPSVRIDAKRKIEPKPGQTHDRQQRQSDLLRTAGLGNRQAQRNPARPETDREEQKNDGRLPYQGRVIPVKAQPDEPFADLLHAKRQRHERQRQKASDPCERRPACSRVRQAATPPPTVKLASGEKHIAISVLGGEQDRFFVADNRMVKTFFLRLAGRACYCLRMQRGRMTSLASPTRCMAQMTT